MKKFMLLGVLLALQLSAKEKPKEFQQGKDSFTKNIAPTYNYPASVALKNGYDLFGSVSYIFWHVSEGGLDLAATSAYINATNTVIPATGENRTLFQDQEYKSGFQIGFGYITSEDAWTLRADYTRLHQTTDTNADAPDAANGTGAFYTTDWFFQTSSQGQSPAGGTIASTWKMDLDMLDISLGREYYSGRKFLLFPFGGFRALWLDQSLTLKITDILNVNPPSTELNSRNVSDSWALGPRVGIRGSILLGAGFKSFAHIATSLLFTRYTKVRHTEDPFAVGADGVTYAFRNRDVLRPIQEAGLGISWSSYIYQMRYFVLLEASYDFQYLWEQNMLRALNDANVLGTNPSANNLYLHGLTIRGAFYF